MPALAPLDIPSTSSDLPVDSACPGPCANASGSITPNMLSNFGRIVAVRSSMDSQPQHSLQHICIDDSKAGVRDVLRALFLSLFKRHGNKADCHRMVYEVSATLPSRRRAPIQAQAKQPARCRSLLARRTTVVGIRCFLKEFLYSI